MVFPPTHLALTEPDGLLAIGGALTSEWLLHAYQRGIFPWFNESDPILWWTPNPRSVFLTQAMHISRSMRRTLKKHTFEVSFDQAFDAVTQACAQTPRPGQAGTWIVPEMLDAYQKLHQQSHAHSVEVWSKGQLVGGLYGVSMGRMFFGESMFSTQSNASKVALIALATQLRLWGFELIDTQMPSPHLQSLGARLMSREHFESHVSKLVKKPGPETWTLDPDWVAHAMIFEQWAQAKRNPHPP